MSEKSFLKKVIDAPLHWQIFSAMIIGVLIAVLLRQVDSSGLPDFLDSALNLFSSISEGLGQIFVRLLKMVIVPLVLSSIIVGVASVGDAKNLGRLGGKTVGFYMLTSFLATVLGLVLSNTIQPGQGVDMTRIEGSEAVTAPDPTPLSDIFFRLIPLNPFQAMVETDMLAIIFFAIIFGVALTRVKQEHHAILLPFIDACFQVMMKLTHGIIRLAPIGVYGLIFRAVSNLDLAFFSAIGRYMLTLTAGLTLHLFLTLPIVYYLFTRKNPIHHFKNMTNALLTAFSTSSSSATLPVTIECVELNSGVSNRITSFVLPLGATVNMDGTALFECLGVLFIAQALGFDLSLSQQIVIVITALLASIGAAGIPSAGLVMIFIVLQAVGISGDKVTLIVGAMFAIDRPLDMYRTAINVFSDSVGTVIIAQSEGELLDPQTPEPTSEVPS